MRDAQATLLQIFGCLMLHPQYLSDYDKYQLSVVDFEKRLDKMVFCAIDNAYQSGAIEVRPIDVENWIQSNNVGAKMFKEQNYLRFLQDAVSLAEISTFPVYYTRLKKYNLLDTMKANGFDISNYYIENPVSSQDFDINAKFEALSLDEIVNDVKYKLINIEKAYLTNNEIKSWSAADEIDDIVNSFGQVDNFGLTINGEYMSAILNGASLDALTIRSLGSGVGKTRMAVADACKLAYPFCWNTDKCEWEASGHNERVLFIVTEQTVSEVMRMVVAYLTGIEDVNLKYGQMNDAERKRVSQAQLLIHNFKENLTFMRIPDPNVSIVKTSIREKIMATGAQYVFYDYIFVSPALINEFHGSIRNDEALLLMATALKDLAIENHISIFTSTQVSAKVDDNTKIRNEGVLAGGRATINKADNGIIGARPTKDEIEFLRPILQKLGITTPPNVVFDVFKVRSGRWTQVRLWSNFDTGNLRLNDLFVTDANFNIIDNIANSMPVVSWELEPELEQYLNCLNEKA